MRSKQVRVYTVPGCIDCAAVKHLLSTAGIPFEEIDVSNVPHARDALALLSGRRSLPQVFVGARFVGQVGEVRHLIQTGTFRSAFGIVGGEDPEPSPHPTEP